MHEIKRFDPISVGKIFGFIGVVIGFLMAILMLIMQMAVGSMMSSFAGLTGADVTGMTGVMSLFGGFMLIAFPVMIAISAFIMGIIYAFVYNLIAGKLGGIEIELKETSGQQTPVRPQQQPQQYQQPPNPQPSPQQGYQESRPRY